MYVTQNPHLLSTYVKIYTDMNVCALLFWYFFSLYLHLDSIYCLVYITKYFVCTRVYFFSFLILTVLLLYRYFITYLSEFSTFMLEIIFTNILHAVTCSSRFSYSQWTMLHRNSMLECSKSMNTTNIRFIIMFKLFWVFPIPFRVMLKCEIMGKK